MQNLSPLCLEGMVHETRKSCVLHSLSWMYTSKRGRSSAMTAACGVMFAMDGEADAMVGDAGTSNAHSSSWTEAGIRLGSSMALVTVSRRQEHTTSSAISSPVVQR